MSYSTLPIYATLDFGLQRGHGPIMALQGHAAAWSYWRIAMEGLLGFQDYNNSKTFSSYETKWKRG
jgi:hypothetical protein